MSHKNTDHLVPFFAKQRSGDTAVDATRHGKNNARHRIGSTFGDKKRGTARSIDRGRGLV